MNDAMRVTDHPVLGKMKEAETITIYYDGKPIEAIKGEPVAAALINAGVVSFRTTPKSGKPRGIFCAIGRCTDCMMTVNGVPNTRTCVTPAEDGMSVETQHGLGEMRLK